MKRLVILVSILLIPVFVLNAQSLSPEVQKINDYMVKWASALFPPVVTEEELSISDEMDIKGMALISMKWKDIKWIVLKGRSMICCGAGTRKGFKVDEEVSYLAINFKEGIDIGEDWAYAKVFNENDFVPLVENLVRKKGGHLTKRKYDWIGKTVNGIAAVGLDNKIGFINNLANEITQIKYDDVYKFSKADSNARVIEDGKWGLVDMSGREIVSPRYDTIGEFDKGGYAMVKKSDKAGFINKTGKEIIPLTYDYVYKFINDDRCPFRISGKWGYIDRKNNIVVPAKYETVSSYYQNGFAFVSIGEKYGFVNKEGKEITPLKYEDVGFFDNGLAPAKLGGKLGFINTEGKEIIPIKYNGLFRFQNQDNFTRAAVEGKWGLINKAGKEITALRYDTIGEFDKGGYACMEINNKCGLLNKDGREIVSPKYDRIDDFNDAGLAEVKLNEKWGIINRDGKEITPLKYDLVLELEKKGFFKVKVKNKWGIINGDGKEITPIKYDEIGYYVKFGLVQVGYYTSVKYFDKKDGKQVTPTNDNLSSITMRIEGKWGFVNDSGAEVVPPKYDRIIESFNDKGYAKVLLGKEQYIIDKEGKIIQ